MTPDQFTENRIKEEVIDLKKTFKGEIELMRDSIK